MKNLSYIYIFLQFFKKMCNRVYFTTIRKRTLLRIVSIFLLYNTNIYIIIFKKIAKFDF